MCKSEAIEAGELLDSLMATEVMGEPVPEFTPEFALDLQLAGSPVKSARGNWRCWCRYGDGDIPTWRPLPYSTDMSAAWLVWLAITEDDPYRWAIYPNPEKSDEVIVEHYSYYGGQECGEGELSIVGLPPEAICKAALLARLAGGRYGS